MARKRMISQDFLTSQDLAGASMRLRLGFVAVILFLDDEGRAQDDAEVIRAFAWPRDKVTTRQMADDLAEMAQRTVICRYEVDGKSYLHSPKWDVWQKVQHKSKSRIPPCPTHDLHEDFVNLSRRSPETFTPNVVQPNSDQSSSSQVKRAGRDLTSRSAALAAAYIAKQPLANRYQVQGIIAQAIGEAAYPDQQVAAALDRLASAGMTVTQNTLLVELNGQRKTSTTNQRVSDALVIAERLREQETIPSQRAIGAGS